MLDAQFKRKRAAFEDDVSTAKANRYSLNVTSTTKPRTYTPTASTPRLSTFVIPSTTPASAPAAGRSPTRRTSKSSLLHPRKRFIPPPSTTSSPSLSLSAALKGTKKSRSLSLTSQKKSHTTIEQSRPKSWFFDIYEEAEETQEYRMNEWTMTQSTTGLDISDDESQISPSKKQLTTSDRGKENIDPNEIALPPVTRAQVAAASMAETKEVKMTEKDRVALGDLNPAEYYAEGLDATSVVLVHDEDEEAETDVEDHDQEIARPDAKEEFTFQAPAPPSTLSHQHTSSTESFLNTLETPSLAEILSSSTPYISEPVSTPATSLSDSNDIPIATDYEDKPMTIDIWESESAKDENEGGASPRSVTVEGDSGFALQEL
jgi:hypothetical protein